MPYLTQLADVARRTGHPVVEVPGWKTRGHGPQPAVAGVVCHHTAGWNDMHVVRDGRPGLDGPLSHIWLRRDGRIYVIAAGRCWHNAPSTSPFHDNGSALGIEAENDGRAAWPAVQLDAYRRLCVELCREFGMAASRVKGHKEVNTAKPDPHSIDMNDFRAEVARLMNGDDVSADDVWALEIPVPFGKADNPAWQAKSIIVNTAKWVRDINAKLDAQNAAVRELAAALAAHHEGVDVDALVVRIEAAIESVTIKLNVGE